MPVSTETPDNCFGFCFTGVENNRIFKNCYKQIQPMCRDPDYQTQGLGMFL